MHRSPPDGGECYENDKPIEKMPQVLIESPQNKEKKKTQETPRSKEQAKKQNKKLKNKKQNSLDKNATKELDEIFGKIRRTPDQSSFDEEDDKFNLSFSNHKFR